MEKRPAYDTPLAGASDSRWPPRYRIASNGMVFRVEELVSMNMSTGDTTWRPRLASVASLSEAQEQLDSIESAEREGGAVGSEWREIERGTIRA